MFLITFRKSLSGMTEFTVLKNKNIVKESLQEKFKKYLTHYDVLQLEFFTSVGTLIRYDIEDEVDLERVLNALDNAEPYSTGDERLDKIRLLNPSSWQNTPTRSEPVYLI